MNMVTLCVVAVILILMGAFLPIFFYIQNLKRKNHTLRKACEDLALEAQIAKAKFEQLKQNVNISNTLKETK